MCAQATAKRRRSQARNGFRHLAKKQRPTYKRPDAEKSLRRMQKRVETERRMAHKAKKG